VNQVLGKDRSDTFQRMGLRDSLAAVDWRARLADAGQWGASRLRSVAFKIDEEEASYERRGIEIVYPPACEALEAGGRHFSRGFNAAMRDTRAREIVARIEQLDPAFRGFAFEGAGMALIVLDALLPPRRRFTNLLHGPGDRWSPLLHIGAGWAYARMGRVPQRPPDKLDPVFGWLLHDGAGFHEAYFKIDRFVEEQERPEKLSGPGLRLFDQGVGRALLFDRGGDVEAVAETIARFAEDRHADLWSGVGLCATYAGGLSEERLRRLRDLAGPHHLRLAQGAAIAVLGRARAGNPTADVGLAASVLCGLSFDQVAQRSEAALADLSRAGDSPFEAWQARLRESFATELAPL
jgi:hypothetical protein